MFSLSDIILFFGAFLSLMLVLPLLVKKKVKNRQANFLLGLFFFVWFLSFLLKVADQKHLEILLPHISKLNYPVGLLRSVFFYLYIFYLTRPEKKFNYLQLFHLLPFVCIFIYFSPYYFLSAEAKKAIMTGLGGTMQPIRPGWYSFFAFSYSLLYLLLSTLNVVRFYRVQQKIQVKSVKETFTWLILMLFGYLFFILLSLLPFIFRISHEFNNIAFLLLAFYMVVCSSCLMKFPDTTEQKKAKYTYSGLDTATGKDHFLMIKEILENEKLYRKEGLKLSDLAAKAGLPENTVSQVVNEFGKTSFLHFINTYRVKESMELLADPQRQLYTIESIGYEVGFNSRASFYAAFKKIANVTPSEYKARLKQNNV